MMVYKGGVVWKSKWRQYSAAWYLRKKYAGCHAEDTDELLSGKGFIQKEHAAESAKDHFQT
jgi:hypothetical protein